MLFRQKKNLWICAGLGAFLIRLIASFTHAHWFHPDEWCQTLEPAQILAHGFGLHSQEVGLHLRNLSWPLLIAAVLKAVHFFSPHSIDHRFLAVNFLCGFLDLFLLWGWMKVLKTDRFTSGQSKNFHLWALILLIFPWFTVYESVNPRAEHISEIALWITLGCLASRLWILAGIASIAIFAVRYPSGLLTLGLGIGILIHALQKKEWRPFLKYTLGTGLGLFLFGLADWIYYGRPWESLWMYLQYNIFTGSSAQVFGRQGVSVYAEPFLWNWTTFKLFIPIGIGLGLSSLYGFWMGLSRLQPWALAFLFYLIGHFLTPHKEGRFMVPIEHLFLWSATLGASLILEKRFLNKITHFKKYVTAFLILILIYNGFALLYALRADLWKKPGTYREVEFHLAQTPRVCAILTSGQVVSLMIPFQNNAVVPDPPLGSFGLDQDRLGYPRALESPLDWIERAPHCHTEDAVLLHVTSYQKEWSQEDCQLLPSSILRILPSFASPWFLEKNWVKGAWYRCPPSLLNHFSIQRTALVFSRSYGKIPELPPLGTTVKELRELGIKTSIPPLNSLSNFPQN